MVAESPSMSILRSLLHLSRDLVHLPTLIRDLLVFLRSMSRDRACLAAENLFLRKQHALLLASNLDGQTMQRGW